MLFELALLLLGTDLSPDTAARLKVAWTADTHATPPNGRAEKIAAFEATPVFADGQLFVITPFNQVIAMDPATGAEHWRFDPHVADRGYSEASARGVTVSRGIVYFGTLDARLIAINARDGKQVWQATLGDGPNDGGYQITSPPIVVGNVVIVGSSIGDNGRAELQHGTVRAFEAADGKPKWTWDPTPPGRTGAANAWAPMSADPGRDLVFVPTGSASPDFFGGARPGDNRYANSVVALQASTGHFVWAFQVVHHDLWDYDVASRPELVEVRGTAAIAVLTKVGHYFALDRATGKPLLPVEERPVPASNVAGEAASPTQPFPSSGVFTEQRFVPRAGWCADEFAKLRYDGLFTPPSAGGTLIFPGNVGGANWGSGSVRFRSRPPLRGRQSPGNGGAADSARVVRFRRSRRDRRTLGAGVCGPIRDPMGNVPQDLHRSRRTAVRAGTMGRACRDRRLDRQAAVETPMLPSLGGPLTVNGVVFFGGTVFETKLRAFAADDGRKLWEADLPFSAHSVPATYEWQGKRYVVVCAGGHGKVDGSKLGGAVIAFAIE